jgi:hypothetical protein
MELVTLNGADAPNSLVRLLKWNLVIVLALALTGVLAGQVPSGSRRSRQGKQAQAGISPLETPPATFHGTLRSQSKKEIVLALPEDQSVAFHISHKTKFLKDGKAIKASEIAEGAALTVEGKRDLMGNVEAVSVTVDTSAKPAAAPTPAQK